jgi:hypothetical protein
VTRMLGLVPSVGCICTTCTAPTGSVSVSCFPDCPGLRLAPPEGSSAASEDTTSDSTINSSGGNSRRRDGEAANAICDNCAAAMLQLTSVNHGDDPPDACASANTGASTLLCDEAPQQAAARSIRRFDAQMKPVPPVSGPAAASQPTKPLLGTAHRNKR